MKKKTYIILGFFILLQTAPAVVWGAPDFFQDYSHYFSYGENIFITGGKLNLSLGELNFSTNFNNYNYGVTLFSDKYLKHFPCELQVGNLLIGGITSRLKDPLLDSGVDGFTSYYTEPALVTSQLPSSTTFSKPFSTFLELGFLNEDKPVERIVFNGAYTPDNKDMSFSTLGKFNIKEKISITAATGINLFTIEEHKPTSWYSDLPYYSSRKSFAVGNELSIKLFDMIHSCFSVYLYNSADYKFGSIYKLENKVQWDKFIFSLCGYLNTQKFLITPDNKILYPTAQIKSNFEFINSDYFKTGVTFYSKIPLTPPISPDFKFGAAITFSNNLTTLNCQSSFTFNLLNIEENNPQLVFTYFSSRAESLWNLGKIKPSIIFSSRLYLSSVPKNNNFFAIPQLNTHSHSITIRTEIFDDLITGNSTFSFSCKNHEIYNKKLNFGISLNKTFKKIIVIVKFNGEICI